MTPLPFDRNIVTSGTRYLTNRSPEGAMVIETVVNGRPITTQRRNSAGTQIGRVTRAADGRDTTAEGEVAADYADYADESGEWAVKGSHTGVDFPADSFLPLVPRSSAKSVKSADETLPLGCSSVDRRWAASNGGTTNSTVNRFVHKASEVPSHDEDGNQTGDGRWHYRWDAENRLVEMETTTAATTAGAPYAKVRWTYDPLGRRIQRQSWQDANPVVVTKYVYDGWQCIAELDGSNVETATYAWGKDLSGSRTGAGGVGGLLWVHHAQHGRHFYAYDGNGNVCGLTSATDGTRSGGYEYDPFGGVIRVDAANPVASWNEWQFSTKRKDPVAEVVLYEYRGYDVRTGRWLSRDPIGEQGGLGSYTLVAQNPIQRIDVFGLIDTFTAGDPLAPGNAKPLPSNPFDESLPPIGEGYGFHVAFNDQTRRRTGVDIRYECPKGEDGDPICKNPKLSQIAITIDSSILGWISSRSRDGNRWFVDSDTDFPFYGSTDNPQTGSYGTTTIYDRPGLPVLNPTHLFSKAYQLFETCAVCTDDGIGKYWIIGCVLWGHSVGGASDTVSRWGNGFNQLPIPPSQDFQNLFPRNRLRTQESTILNQK